MSHDPHATTSPAVDADTTAQWVTVTPPPGIVPENVNEIAPLFDISTGSPDGVENATV